MVFSLLNRLFIWFYKMFWKALGSIKRTVSSVLTLSIVVLVILWLAVFLYGSFYYNYIPAESHVKDVNFHFSPSRKKSEGLGSFPEANISLLTDNRQQLLAGGQTYSIKMDIEMPESPVNKGLGMFMVKLWFYGRHGETVYSASRSAMLKYKSDLLHTLETVFYIPMMLLGFKDQKQNVEVELVSSYNQDPYKPALGVHLQIEQRHVEMYSATLLIEAQFSGVRYILHRWPVMSAICGISLNIVFLSLVMLLSWYNLMRSEDDSASQPVLHHVPSPSSSIASRDTDKWSEDGSSHGSVESEDFTDVTAEAKRQEGSETLVASARAADPENLTAEGAPLPGEEDLRLRKGFTH